MPDITVLGCEYDNHGPDSQVNADSVLNEATSALATDPTKPIKRLYDELVATAHRSGVGLGGHDQPPIFATEKGASNWLTSRPI